jgi:hypothetical protein
MTKAGRDSVWQSSLRWVLPFFTGAVLIQVVNVTEAFTKLYGFLDGRREAVLEFRTPAIPMAQKKPQFAVFRGTVSRAEISPGCWNLQAWTTLESESETPYIAVELLKKDRVIAVADNNRKQVSRLVVLPPIEPMQVKVEKGEYLALRVDQASGGGDVSAKGDLKLSPQPFYRCW